MLGYVKAAAAFSSTWVQELAQAANDTEKVKKMTKQLEELEERAEELDRQRTKGLSAIRYAWPN